MLCDKCERDVYPASVRGLCLDCWADEKRAETARRLKAAAESFDNNPRQIEEAANDG